MDDSSYIAIKKTVKTLAGSSLQVLDFTDSLTTADYNTFLAEAQNFKARYPGDVVILANPLLKYNCHAYAWHKYFSDCQKIWMDYPEAQVYMTDGSFLQKGYLAPSDSYPAGAEIISYQTPSVADLDHSARVYRASQKIVKSKWGAGCLVQHEQTHCPYYVTGKTNFVAYGVNPTWVS